MSDMLEDRNRRKTLFWVEGDFKYFFMHWISWGFRSRCCHQPFSSYNVAQRRRMWESSASCSHHITSLRYLCVCLSQMSGRSLANLSQRDILRILAASQHPITMQIKGQRGCGTEADRGAWEPLPLNLQHLNLPLPVMGAGLNASSPSYQDR